MFITMKRKSGVIEVEKLKHVKVFTDLIAIAIGDGVLALKKDEKVARFYTQNPGRGCVPNYNEKIENLIINGEDIVVCESMDVYEVGLEILLKHSHMSVNMFPCVDSDVEESEIKHL